MLTSGSRPGPPLSPTAPDSLLERPHDRHLYTVAQVRAIEAWAQADAGLDALALMERAGEASLASIRKWWPTVRSLGILAGPGNNGGDGLALARLALQAGYAVRISQVGAPATDPARHMAGQLAARHTMASFTGTGDDAEPELWVDALLGIGLNRPPEGLIRAAIEKLNATATPVLSLDIPSGLDGDTGSAPGGRDSAVRASATVTFLCHKRGLFTGAASRYVGQRLELATLGLRSECLARVNPAAVLLDEREFETELMPRDPASHKGDWGHVLIVGGGLGWGGSVRLVAEGALRAGAGLVSVLTRPEHVAGLIAARPEAMVRGTEEGRVPDALLERADLAVVGCGLGQDRWGQALWAQMREWPKSLIVDADGLNLLAQSPGQREDWLLTPHPGEAARLLHTEVEVIEKNRFEACAEMADRYRASIVLKGAGTVVSGHPQAVCPYGNPGMASGGMGDFLSGIVAGLVAQGIPLERAAALGVLIHARAGDDAARCGSRGLLATDLAPFVRARVNPAGSPNPPWK